MLKHMYAFIRGAAEFRSDATWGCDDENLMVAYDWGREWAHRATFRRYDSCHG